MTDKTLDGMVAVVTGASRGIGAAIASRLASEGAAVAITARTRDEGEHVLEGSLSTTAASIRAAGGICVPVVANLGKAGDRPRLIETVNAELGPIDILVNNAAVTYRDPIATFAARRYELMFDVQVRAPFELAQMVLPAMKARGRGWIVNISSGAARHPWDRPYDSAFDGTVYGMCKAALDRFTTGLASEVYADGIAVNALSPSGLVVTPGVLYHGLHETIPLDGQEPVERMAEAAYLLCSGDPSVLTGRITYARPLLEEMGISVE